jgi:predicted GNAT family N-acyltransferase
MVSENDFEIFFVTEKDQPLKEFPNRHFCIFTKKTTMIRISKIDHNEKCDIETAFGIRRKVFVQEQKVDPELEYDEHEQEATHYLAYYNDIPVGTARWRYTQNGVKLERFAVLAEYRKKGIGDALVRKVLEDVLPLGKEVYLHSQLTACGLYRRNGFVEEGDIFVEAGIEHYKMRFVPR